MSRLESDVLEEALQASVVRIEVGGVWESGGELGQIDGFDLEQSDDDGGQAGDASTVQGKGRLEQVGKHGRVLHGCNLLRRESLWIGRGLPP